MTASKLSKKEAEEQIQKWQIGHDQYELFKTNLASGIIKVNFNGHFSQSTESISLNEIKDKYRQRYFEDKITSAASWSMVYADEPFIASKTKLGYLDKHMFETCGECGNRIVFAYDGETVYVVHEEDKDINTLCTEPGGIREYLSTLSVPSGKLVFANDLRSLVPEGDKDRYVNYNIEIKKTTLDYAAVGMSHGFTGNSCPSVYKDGDTLVVGNNNYDEDDEDGVPPEEPIKGEKVGYVCTDLWWYSAMDYNLFMKLTKEKTWPKERIDAYLKDFTVEVTPGEYEITHNLGSDGYYYAGIPDIYATFRLKECSS